jgi:nitroreductase
MTEGEIHTIRFKIWRKNMGKVYDTILRRRTIRKFKQDYIPDDMLQKLVNAARVAPSAANLQPLEYIIVSDKEVVDEVFTTLKWAGYIAPLGNPLPGERPVAYVVVLINRNIKEHGGNHDSGAAIENMVLTAMEEGIASCWIASIEREKLKKKLNVPDYLEIDSVVALGYPLEESAEEEIVDSIKYWKDNEGKMHVPKRKLTDILHWNRM